MLTISADFRPILFVHILFALGVVLLPQRVAANNHPSTGTTGKISSGAPAEKNAPKTTVKRPANRSWTGASYLIPSWSLAIPGADAYDFTPDFSFAGLSAELRIRIHPRFSTGVQVDWHHFSAEAQGTKSVDETAITSLQSRELDVIPVFATFHFYLVKRRSLLPWLGLGAGALCGIRKSEQFLPPSSILESEQRTWQFAYTVQSGMMVMMRRLPLSLGVVFQHAPATTHEPSAIMTAFNIGIGIPL